MDQDVYIRRKGVALVESEKGILLVSDNGREFSLPGGKANPNETREQASKRELEEETGMHAVSSFYFHSYTGRIWHDKYNQITRNHAKVFIVDAEGEPAPRSEIKAVTWWTPDSRVRLSHITNSILHKYRQEFSRDFSG